MKKHVNIKYKKEIIKEACSKGDYYTIKRIIQSGDVKGHEQVEESQALLHIAVNNRNRAVVMQIIQAGGDLGIKAGGGVTAMHLAAENGAATILKELLRSGENPNVQDDEGMSPLHTGT